MGMLSKMVSPVCRFTITLLPVVKRRKSGESYQSSSSPSPVVDECSRVASLKKHEEQGAHQGSPVETLTKVKIRTSASHVQSLARRAKHLIMISTERPARPWIGGAASTRQGREKKKTSGGDPPPSRKRGRRRLGGASSSV